MRKEERQTGDGSRKRLETKHHGFLILATFTEHVQTTNQAFKMTTRKTSTYQDSSNLKLQTGKQGKHNTSVPHFSQPNSTQATIALVVSNCKKCQTLKTSKHTRHAQQSSPAQATIALGPLNCKHETLKNLLCAQKAFKFTRFLASFQSPPWKNSCP